jgi:hypothetical protein
MRKGDVPDRDMLSKSYLEDTDGLSPEPLIMQQRTRNIIQLREQSSDGKSQSPSNGTKMRSDFSHDMLGNVMPEISITKKDRMQNSTF